MSTARPPMPKEIADLLAVQQLELRKIERSSLKQMSTALREARTDLREKIRKIGSKGDPFTLQRHRAMLIQVEDASRTIARRAKTVLQDSTKEARTRSIEHLGQKLAMGEKHFLFESVIPFKEIERLVTGNSKLRTIEAFRISRGAAKYGMDLVTSMERRMAHALLTNQTMDQAAASILGKGPWAEKEWQATRLVRTEVSNAYNAVARVGMDKVARGDKDLWIEWVEHASGPQWAGPEKKPWPGPAAPTDAKTAHDSTRLHGQLRRPGQLFDDPMSGMQYAHPPNRPMDRGQLMLVRVVPEKKKEAIA